MPVFLAFILTGVAGFLISILCQLVSFLVLGTVMPGFIFGVILVLVFGIYAGRWIAHNL